MRFMSTKLKVMGERIGNYVTRQQLKSFLLHEAEENFVMKLSKKAFAMTCDKFIFIAVNYSRHDVTYELTSEMC